MDLLEIQRLHAQYTRQPLTIDMPATAGLGAPLSLPSPNGAARAARQWKELFGRSRNFALIVGGLGLAAVFGMGAASFMHRGNPSGQSNDALESTGPTTQASATGGPASQPATEARQAPVLGSATASPTLSSATLAPAAPATVGQVGEQRNPPASPMLPAETKNADGASDVRTAPASQPSTQSSAQAHARRTPPAAAAPIAAVKPAPVVSERNPVPNPTVQHGDIKLF